MEKSVTRENSEGGSLGAILLLRADSLFEAAGRTSKGYWLSHVKSAPRSIMPCCISSNMGVLGSSAAWAYSSATFFSTEHEVKPNSTPPRTLETLSLNIRFLGRHLREMPR